MNVLDRLNEEAKKEFWASLALRYCEGMTARLLAKILRHYQSAYAAYEQLGCKSLLNVNDPFFRKIPHTVRSGVKGESWRFNALKEWQEAQKTDCEVILWTDYRYPLALKYLADAPVFLYAKGNTGLLSHPTLAIVGSRKPHPNSLKRAEKFAHELSSLGLCIVSGMACGIDQATHCGALNGQGKTIAVLGTGINLVYPRQHEVLYHQIAEQGLLLSEFSPFMKPLAQNFPIRNRLITGISEGVLIIEAALKSGSLITARLALEQNKNVYVCKPFFALHSLGGQKLLEDGALAVEDSRTLIADLVPHLMLQYEQFAEKQEKSKKDRENEEIEKNSENFLIPPKKACVQDSDAKMTMLSAKNPSIIEPTDYLSSFSPAFERHAQNNKNIFSVNGNFLLKKFHNDIGMKEKETSVYADYISKPIENTGYSFRKIFNRPALDDNLEPLPLDFGAMAREILYKKSVTKQNKKKATQNCNQKAIVHSVKKKSNVGRDKSVIAQRESMAHISCKEYSIQEPIDFFKNDKEKAFLFSQVECFIDNNAKSLISNNDNVIVSLLRQFDSLSADEILQALQMQGVEMEMTALSADLLMLEVEGLVEKMAGARYRICDD